MMKSSISFLMLVFGLTACGTKETYRITTHVNTTCIEGTLYYVTGYRMAPAIVDGKFVQCKMTGDK